MRRPVLQSSARPKIALLLRTGCAVLALAYPAIALGPFNVLERSYNKYRTGANTSETTLTLTNVKSGANQFHKQFVLKVDGKIEGSPLYASAVAIAGGTHNVI